MKISIKEELYHYAYKEKYDENNLIKKNSKKESVFMYVGIFFTLFVFSLPMMLVNTIQWLLVTIACSIVILVGKREKNQYLKDILYLSIFLAYVGIIIVGAVIVAVQTLSVTLYYSEFIISTILSILVYDVCVLIKVMKKRYSDKKAIKATSVIKRSGYFWGPLAGVAGGRLVVRLFIDTPVPNYLLLLFVTLIFVSSFSFFQKYVLCKLFYKRKI